MDNETLPAEICTTVGVLIKKSNILDRNAGSGAFIARLVEERKFHRVLP